jgi:intracellular multiplication protein IcmK
MLKKIIAFMASLSIALAGNESLYQTQQQVSRSPVVPTLPVQTLSLPAQNNDTNTPVNRSSVESLMVAPNSPTTPSGLSVSDDHMSGQDWFQDALRSVFPLSPEQIMRLRSRFEETRQAQAMPPDGVSPAPVATSIMVALSPGVTPPIVRTYQGFVSTLVFLDAKGVPWPISAYNLGNPNAFSINWDRKNILMIQAKTAYTYGNLVVQLAELETPVVLTLVPNQRLVDYRLDVRVQGVSPQASDMSMPYDKNDGHTDVVPQALITLLDGVPPEGVTRITTDMSHLEIWQLGKTLYLRSRLPLVSPSWTHHAVSGDGTHVYQLPITPMLLMAMDGQLKTVRVTLQNV